MTPDEQVKKITQALIGFSPGDRVRVRDLHDCALSTLGSEYAVMTGTLTEEAKEFRAMDPASLKYKGRRWWIEFDEIAGRRFPRYWVLERCCEHLEE